MPENLINRPAVALNLPVTPIVGNIPTDDSSLNVSATDMWKNSLATTNSLGVEEIPMSSIYTGERYNETRPGTDYEEMFGQQQTWPSKMVNGVGKGLALTGTTFLQSTVGLVNGIGQSIHDGRLASFYDNEMNRSLDKFNKTLEDKWANYYTNAERDAHWYSPSKILSGNFIWDGIVKNLGFAAGAALAGMTFAGGIGAISKALGTIPQLGKLVSIGKAAEAAAATEEALLGVEKAAETVGKVKSVSDKFLSTYKVLNPGQRILVAGLATTGEAGFEAYQNLNQFRNNKIQEFKDNNHGKAPIGTDLESINKEADSVGNWSFSLNVGLLSATNYIQFPKILGSSYKVEKGMINSIAKETGGIIEKAGVYSEKVGKKGILSTLNKIRPYTFSISEGFEEGAQNAIQVGTEDYYNKKYSNTDTDFFDSLYEGVSKTLSTDEGMEQVLIGGLSGALMLGRGKYKEAKNKSTNTREAIEQFNRFKISDFTKETLGSIARGTVLQQDRETLLKAGELSASKDKEADYILNYLAPRIKYGRYDLVQSDIDTFRDLASSDEGFAQLQSEGKALTEDTKEAYLQRLIGFEQTAKNVKTMYQSLHLRYGSQVDNSNTPIYTPTLMDKLVYASSKVTDYDDRIARLTPEVILKGIDVNQIVDDVNNDIDTSYIAAVAQIDAMKIIDEEKVSLKIALGDVVRMNLYKTQFLKEYSEMKKSPKKFQDVVEITPIVDENGQPIPKSTVKIKTKNINNEFEIGTEYYLGKVVEYDKNGNEVYRTPKITILGENEDGTIQIKSSNGNVKNISKEELADYKLGKVESVEGNKKAKFFQDNWNTVYEHFGIKINGKPAIGRLEYSPKEGILVFTYKDAKGKIQHREVSGKLFQTKKGYNHPMISAKGELTVGQQKSTEEFIKAKDERSNFQRENRLKILSDLYDELSGKQEKIKSLIERKTNELHNINTGLELLREDIESENAINQRVKKTTQFKKLTKKYLEASVRLTRTKEQLEQELSDLESQKDDIDNTIAYVEDMSQNIDELPIDSKDLMNELKDHLGLLQNVQKEITNQISSIAKLIEKINKLINSTFEVLNDFVKEFQQKYPKTPMAILGQTWIDFLQSNPNFLKLKPNFKEDLGSLEDLIIETEDFEIVPNQEKLKEFSNQMLDLEEQLKDVQKEYTAIDTIYSKFKEIADIYKEQKAEEKLLSHNEKLKDEYIGTMDTDVQSNFDERHYELNSKKTNEQVRDSTITNNADVPYQKRTDGFGNRWAKFDEEKRKTFKLLDVTQATEEEVGLLGLIRHMLPIDVGIYKADEMIVAVIVNDKGQLVDEFGDPLEENTNPLEYALFQVRPLPKLDAKGHPHLTATYKDSSNHDVSETMFRDDTPEDIRRELELQYAERRKQILIQDKLGKSYDFTPSFGTVEYVTRLDENGKEIIDYSARTPVEDSGLVSPEMLGETQVIKVLTTNDNITEGSVTFKLFTGAVVLKIPGIGLAKLFNRKFSDKEANTIFDGLLQITKNAQEEGSVKKGTKSDRLFNWLRTTVYWGIAKDFTTKEPKPAGYNNIWFEDIIENGKPVSKLKISGKNTEGFTFTPTGLLNAKNDIILLIKELYNNTNATQINKPTSVKYSELIGIDGQGEPIMREWTNYQTYLLSNTNPDGSQRKTEEIPLVTQFRPIKGEDDFNRKNIYFTITSTIDDHVATPIEKVEERKTEEFVLDGVKDNTIQIGTFGSTTFKLDAKKYIASEGKEGFTPTFNGELVQVLITQKGFTEEKARDIIGASILNKLKPQLIAYAIPVEPAINDTTSNESSAFKNRKRGVKPSNPEFEARLAKTINDFEGENWTKLEEFLKTAFPNIPVYRVKNIIQATNGKQAWGIFQDGAIYIYENAEIGTGYHEVFEAVWKMFAGPKEKSLIINEFRNRQGSYQDRITGENIEYSKATEAELKEELSEEFRDFRLTGKLVERNLGKSWISKLFYDLKNFIVHFFTGKDAINNTQKLFDKIGNGYYTQFNPYESKLNYTSKGIIDIEDVFAGQHAEFSRVKEIPYVQLHDILQQMTYSTITELTLNNKSLFTVSENFKKKKTELYNRLKEEILDYIGAIGDTVEDGIANGKYSAKQATHEYNNIETLYNTVEKQWDSIAKAHQERLLSSNIKFDENDDVIINDDENSGKGDYQAANKIDSFRKAHIAIKLLFGTVAQTTNGTSWTPSTIGGVKLLAADVVNIQLLNQLYDAIDPEDMFSKFNDFALKNPSYVALYKRITKLSPSEGQKFDFTNLKGHDIQLIGAFWSAMKKQNADVISVFIQPDGEVQIADSALNSVARQSKKSLFYTLVDVIKNDKTPYFSYEGKTGKYTITKILTDYKLTDIQSYINFLKNLNIDFKFKDINHLTSNQKDVFKSAIEGIQTSFSKMKPLLNKEGKQVYDNETKKPIDYSLITLSSKTLNIEGDLLRLGTIQAIIEYPEYDSTYFNVNGEKTQTYIGTNTGSDLHDIISKVKNIDDLKDTRYKYLLTDVFTSKRVGTKIVSSSVVLQKIFNISSTGKGARRSNTDNILHTQVADGLIDEQTGKKNESSRLKYRQRLLQELNLNSDGIYLTLVPGDASMEWGTRLHNSNDPFVSEEDFLEKRYIEIFKNYFISEIELSRDNRHVVKGKSATDLRFFKDILGETLHRKVIANKESSEKVYEDNKSEINAAIKLFIEIESKDKENLLREYGLIEGSEENIIAENFLFSQDVDLTQKILNTKLQVLTTNYIIANIEFHKLIYSDPYQYSQELKRVKSFSSPAQPLIHSNKSFSETLDREYNEGFEKKDIGWTDFKQEYYRTVTLADVESANDSEGYTTPWEETDGGAIIALKANRIFGLRAGTWTDDNEQQFRYDIAYQKTVQGENLSNQERARRGLTLSEKEKAFEIKKRTNKDSSVSYIGKNPNIKSTYTPKKPIIRGNKENGRNYNDLILDKIAMVVHSFRILHELNPNSNAVRFYNKLENEQVNYAVYKSGRKVGAEVIHQLYIGEKFNDTPFETKQQIDNPTSLQGVTNVPFSIISTQSEVPSKEGHSVTTGSQMTKEATMDLIEMGVPIDIELGKEITHNQELLEAKQLHGYQTLLKKLGIEKTNKGFKITNVKKLITTLKDEVLKQEVNSNIVDALEGFEDGKVVLEATPIYKQIRNILYSIADKNVVRPKINGKQLVQISSTLLEENKIVKETLDNGKTIYTSDVLSWYIDEDGKRVCGIMASRWFDSLLSDEELLNYLNNTPEGQKILGGIAFRIPTQDKNSIDVFKIEKFLPKDFGDSVVVSSALVRKVGSDFDVDKLFVYLKNVYKDNKGNIKAVPYLGIGEQAKQKFGEMFDKGEFLSKKLYQELQAEIQAEGIAPGHQFIQSLFGELGVFTEEEITEDFMDSVIEEGEREMIIDLMYKKSLENEYIQSLERITSHPLNFAQLTRPNSAKDLKDLTKKINAKLGRKEIDYSSPGNMLKWSFMSYLRHAFVTGKQIIGIAAVGQASHSQRQRTLVYSDTSKITPEDKKWLGDGEIKFKEYNSEIINGKKVAVLSKIKSDNGKDFISNVNSAIIDGAVDVSNGTWLIELGFTPNVIATALFLLDSGVSKESVAYFLNQPIIKDYLRNIENKGYSWLFVDNIFSDMIDIYNVQEQMADETELPSEGELFDMIGKKTKDLTNKQKNQQQFILGEFTKYAKMTQQMFTVTQASNYDTANLNDSFLIFQKQEQLKKAQKTIFSSLDENNNVVPAVDNILKSSFVGPLKDLIFDIKDAFAEILIADKPNMRRVMEDVLRSYVDTSSKDFIKISQTAVSNMFDWAMQNSTRVNNKIASILLGNSSEKSAAEQIIAYRDEVLANPKHPLYNNLILRKIKQQGGDKLGKVNNLVITGRDNVYDQNLIIYGFEELKKVLKDENKDLYGKLVRLVVLQSGLTNSPIAFTSLLPYNDFVAIYNETLSSLETMSNLSNFSRLNVFERNNWNNENVTSFIRANMKPITDVSGIKVWKDANMFLDPKRKLQKAMDDGIIPKLVGLNPYEARDEFIVYSWETYISKKNRIVARKTGDRNHIHKALMKKVYNSDGSPMILSNIDKKTGIIYTKYIYKAINAWGDSYKAQELYDGLINNPLSTLGQQSVLDNGFDKYNEVEDYIITDILAGEKEITANAPINELLNTKSMADIPQNKISGIESYGSLTTANDEVKKVLGNNPHSIDMIDAGFRTRTTRSESEMAKYKIKIGDTIKNFGKSADGTTKTIYAKVTAIHPKGTIGWKGTWSKEGWRADDVKVIDRFKDGAAAIEFEVLKNAPINEIVSKLSSQEIKELLTGAPEGLPEIKRPPIKC